MDPNSYRHLKGEHRKEKKKGQAVKKSDKVVEVRARGLPMTFYAAQWGTLGGQHTHFFNSWREIQSFSMIYLDMF